MRKKHPSNLSWLKKIGMVSCFFLVEGVGFESYCVSHGSCKNERQKSLNIYEVVHSTLKDTCNNKPQNLNHKPCRKEKLIFANQYSKKQGCLDNHVRIAIFSVRCSFGWLETTRGRIPAQHFVAVLRISKSVWH